MRKGHHYTEISYTHNHKTLDISALSLHKLLHTAWNMDAISEWGSVVALTYIAAQRVFPDYNEMADAKALLESITRNFGYHYGVRNKVRINTISQSPTRTTAGSGASVLDSETAARRLRLILFPSHPPARPPAAGLKDLMALFPMQKK